MKTIVGSLLLLLLAPVAAFASTPATMHMTVTAAGVQAQTQDAYTANKPIAIDVSADRSLGVRAVAAVLTAPSGSSARVPLAALGNNHFSGTLLLVESGAYTVALQTQIGASTIASGTVSLTSVAQASVPQHVEWAAVGILPIAGFALVGLLRRRANA